MEIHHACHRRPSDYHQPRPRPQGRSGLLAAAVAGDVPARAVPGRAPPRPDRGVRPSGRPSNPARLFRALIEKADQELVLQNRRGKAGAGIRRRGTRPFTFKTTFGEVTVQRSRISHKHDDTIEVPSARAWETSTNCTSPGTSGMRSVISSAIDPRARAVPRSAATPGMRTCWGSARSSTSCIRRASNWSAPT